MNKVLLLFGAGILSVVTVIFLGFNKSDESFHQKAHAKAVPDVESAYRLPAPSQKGNMTVEEAILNRRSRRNFQDKKISTEQLSRILYAAYGITKPRKEATLLRGGLRAAPSAGALYPLEIYVLIGKVDDITPGVYKYDSENHQIIKTIDKDMRDGLSSAALNQKMIKTAPAVILYTAVFDRCVQKYGPRGRERYVCMDLGHSAQNVYLQVEALRLGTCAIGAFNDSKLKKIMELPEQEEPLYIMPIGYCRP